MSAITARRIPVVASHAYPEHMQNVPSTFTAVLEADADQRYFRQAVVVVVDGRKVGYLAPEIGRRYFEPLRQHGQPVTCPGRRATLVDHETSGVDLLLDFGGLSIQPED